MPTTPHSPSIEIEKGEGGNGEATLQQCLAAFVRNENLSGHGRYFCDSCGKDQNATRVHVHRQSSSRAVSTFETFHMEERRHAHQADERRRFPVGGLRFSALLLRRKHRRARRTETPVSTGKRSCRTPRSRASAPTSSTDKLYDLVAVITHHGRQAKAATTRRALASSASTAATVGNTSMTTTSTRSPRTRFAPVRDTYSCTRADRERAYRAHGTRFD